MADNRGKLFALDTFAATLAGLALFMMMAIGAADAFGTKVLARPIPGTYELTETLMVASAFLAMALAQAQGGHIRVTLFIGLFPSRVRAAFDLISNLLSALLFFGIAWYGWESAYHGFIVGEFSSGSLPIPLWPARVALAVGASLMVIQCLADVFRNMRMIAGRSTPDQEAQ